MNSEIGYWLDALNEIGKSPDLHFGVLVKITHLGDSEATKLSFYGVWSRTLARGAR